jgi:hypothetical protein
MYCSPDKQLQYCVQCTAVLFNCSTALLQSCPLSSFHCSAELQPPAAPLDNAAEHLPWSEQNTLALLQMTPHLVTRLTWVIPELLPLPAEEL